MVPGQKRKGRKWGLGRKLEDMRRRFDARRKRRVHESEDGLVLNPQEQAKLLGSHGGVQREELLQTSRKKKLLEKILKKEMGQ
jgi:hypothetical protein